MRVESLFMTITPCFTLVVPVWVPSMGQVDVSKLFDKILFTNPSARAGYNTRSIFKRSLTGLNSEFSFS